MSSREDYISNIKKGDLVAFKTSSLEAKMYSGKITKIGTTKVEVETKNGKKYFVSKENIYWVNTNGKWPSYIMQALKGIDVVDENEETECEACKIVLDEEDKEEVEEKVENIIIEDANSQIIVDVIENVGDEKNGSEQSGEE